MPRKQNNGDKRIEQASDLLDHVRRMHEDAAELIRSLEAARGREARPTKRRRKRR
jgi:hypothetical protein